MTTEAPPRTQTKLCSACQQELPLDAFNRDKSKSLGRASRCKPCNKIVCAAWTAVNRERKRQADRAYYKNNREQVKASAANWRAKNRARNAATSRAWERAHPEAVRQYRALKRARYANVLHVPFTLDQLRARMEYWGSRCWMCGGAFETIDHVKPIVAGGGHLLANLRPACTSCNSSKKGTWPFPTARSVR